MRLCRFTAADGSVRPGLSLDAKTVLDLGGDSGHSLESLLESKDPVRELRALAAGKRTVYPLAEVRLLAPLERQEVWAAGVTYLRSRAARTEESENDASAYDRVYEAERPELFFKCLPEKVVGPGEAIGVRRDSQWSVPEPELTLVISSRGSVVGVTIGNDVSARDIEGANLLYLPQAKIYHRSCSIGPWIVLGWSEAEVRSHEVRLSVRRAGESVFRGVTALTNLKRPFENLVRHLFACQHFPHGVALLTGTGIIPPDAFTLRSGDVVQIEITGIGVLENPVTEV